jgi:hypothetical protein
MTTILDPTDERSPVERQITKRKANLKGVIGLLDISKPRGNILLDELENLLVTKVPGVTVKRYTKPTFAKPCPDKLRREISESCDYLIEALAD